MKKIIFGSASAILAVVGFSSFKSNKAVQTSYYWFQLPAGTSLSVTHPAFAGENAYKGFGQQSTIAFDPCTGSGDLCIIGYTLNAIHGFTVSGTPTALKTVSSLPAPYGTRGGVQQAN